MKKTTKKGPSKASKKAVKDLEVKSGQGGMIRGGPRPPPTSKGWVE